jgi:hypothetical protein
VLALCFSPATGVGQESGITRIMHPWGNCKPGAWKLVRVVTETLDDHQQVIHSSITETKTTLTDIAEDCVTLEVKAVVELAGKQFETEPQLVRQGFHGEPAGQDLKIRALTSCEVVIEGQTIPCRAERLEQVGPVSKTTTTIFYSDAVPPYILKRNSLTTDLERNSVLSEMTMEVMALNMPTEVLNKIRCTAHVKTVQKRPGGSILTLAVVSNEVPGGVVSHTSKELDAQGNLVRRSVLKLLSFSFEPEDGRVGLFGRKRPNRFRNKSMSHFAPPVTPN